MTQKKLATEDRDQALSLERTYEKIRPLAVRLETSICEQISSMINFAGLTLGVPLESRVKSWNSIREKIERNALAMGEVTEMSDLIGVRTIFLFRAEMDTFQNLIRDKFRVESEEDTAERLEESQFGYQSRHMIIMLPKQWSDVPSFEGLSDLRVELQIRTIAQHIWAAASHKLQYKREASVPVPVRRAIYRVSALLETVDLELLRVLDERHAYVEAVPNQGRRDDLLNVDTLRSLLDDKLPATNKDQEEIYDKVLQNLNALSIESYADLVELIDDYLDAAIESDKFEVENRRKDENDYGKYSERLDRGVFFSHSGLIREMLRKKFGNARANKVISSTR